jgi:hypothetical protein
MLLRFQCSKSTDNPKIYVSSAARQWPMEAVTDRALRYRANAYPPPGEKICCLCGATRNVEVGHVNGREEDTAQENLYLPKLQRSIGYRPEARGNRPTYAPVQSDPRQEQRASVSG